MATTWKKVLLIVPPTGKYIREERCQTPLEEMHTIALRPPMDLLYMAGVLEKEGILCSIVDFPAKNQNWEDLRREILSWQPDALVLSITTPTLKEDMKSADLAKVINPRIVTVSKGAHFLHLDRQALADFPTLDVVMRGEYEETILDLAMGKEWGISPASPIARLARLAEPRIVDLSQISMPSPIPLAISSTIRFTSGPIPGNGKPPWSPAGAAPSPASFVWRKRCLAPRFATAPRRMWLGN